MTERKWLYLAIAYAAFCAIAIAAESHRLHHEPMSTAMDKLLVAPFGWGFAAYGLQFGYVYGRFSRVERSESPFTFWINIAFYFLFGLFLFYWGAQQALEHPIQS
jgi:hypothetical protein